MKYWRCGAETMSYRGDPRGIADGSGAERSGVVSRDRSLRDRGESGAGGVAGTEEDVRWQIRGRRRTANEGGQVRALRILTRTYPQVSDQV
jgi:hypothetical protein